MADIILGDLDETKLNPEDVLWKPHPGKQTEALSRSEFEVLYGGARGGGKTDAGIAWLLREVHRPELRALVIRRNADDLRDWIDRANRIYSMLGARMVGKPAEFHWPSGAVFRCGHLKDEAAYTKYQGHEYQRMLIEELTQIPSERAYLRLISSCRSTVKGLPARIFLTTNPGGLGHQWVKRRFIDIAPWGKPYFYQIKIKEVVFKRSRIFIHAQIDDNPTLVKIDPNYILTIEQLKETDPELYKAWRYGDWDVFAGQVFREFNRSHHVLQRVVPRSDYNHFLGVDWGYSGKETDEGAFAALAAVMYEEECNGATFNRVIVYREWYGKHLTPHQWADKIFKESLTPYSDGFCDSSMMNPQIDGSKPIAQLMHEKWDELNKDKYWLRMKPGTKNRIGRVATLHNWLSLAPDGIPYCLFTENCINMIRTIPALIYDEQRVEDVDTQSEDHLYDAVTYMLTYLKFISVVGGISKETFEGNTYFNPKEAVDLGDWETTKNKKAIDWRV